MPVIRLGGCNAGGRICGSSAQHYTTGFAGACCCGIILMTAIPALMLLIIIAFLEGGK